MIKSSTQLLSDIKELDDLVSSYSTTNESTHKEETLKHKREFLLHINIVLRYFYGISWQHKLQFLTDLTKHLNSIGTMELLLNTLYAVSGKTTVYCKCEPDITFVYDKASDDHDRMLEANAMKEYWGMEVEWFKTLVDDNEQIMVIILLLRSAGGNIVWKFYSILQKLYAQKQKTDKLRLSDEEQKAEDQLQKHREKNRLQFSKPHQPEDPLHIKCQKLLHKWNETVHKYKKHIEKEENRLLKLFGKNIDKKKDKKDKKGKKSKKGRKGKGKPKNKKSKSKGSKKKKNKKTKEDSSCDWIQLLPLGTVKRIFNYLDNKTLKKCKKVNGYWHWVITDLMKDRKARKTLDKMIANLSSNIDTSDPSKICEFEEPKKRKTATERRIKKGLDRGAILEKLRHTNDPLVEDCLKQIVVCKRPEDYIAPLYKTKIFPRVAAAKSPLYKFPNLICLDVDRMVSVEVKQDRSEATISRSREASTVTYLSRTEDTNSSGGSSNQSIDASYREYTINI